MRSEIGFSMLAQVQCEPNSARRELRTFQHAMHALWPVYLARGVADKKATGSTRQGARCDVDGRVDV